MFKYNQDDSITNRFGIVTRVSFGLMRTLFKYPLGYFGISFPVLLGKRVSISGSSKKLTIGKYSKIENDVVLQAISKDGIHLGHHVTIGEGTKIRPSGYYGGDIGQGLVIGDGSAIGVNSYIGCSGKIVIGKNVIAGPHLTMIAENHNFDDPNLPIKEQGVSQKGIVIADDVWIGCNVTILDGVKIGSRCVIAAGAVVTKSIDDNSLVAGVPAKLVKRL